MSEPISLTTATAAPSRSSTASSLSSEVHPPNASLPGSSSTSPNSSTSELSSLYPPTPDMPPFAAKTLGNSNAFSLFPSANSNGPVPRPALAVQTQQMEKDDPIRTKTNTRLPDMLPSMDNIRFDPLGGPFPVFGSNGQSGDPLGLNAFLLHPDDGLWNYIQPAPRNDVGAKGRGDGGRSGSESESENERGDIGSMGRKARQIRRQSLGVTTRSPLSGPPLVNPEATELGVKEEASGSGAAAEGTTSSMKSRFGLKKGLKLVKSGTNLAAAAKAAKPPAASLSQPSSPTRGEPARPTLDRGRNASRPLADIPDVPSIPQPFMDAARSESTHSRSTASSSEAGPATPRDSPKELVEIVGVPGKKPMLGVTSGWKSWLSTGQSSKQKKKAKEGPALLTKQPKKLNEAPKADPGLSADPLAGVLPSSIPLSHSTSVNEALHLPSRTRSPMPDQLRAVRTLSIRKMSALRAPSPHPVLPQSSIPAYLAHHGSDSTSGASYMKFPRSVNCMQVPGMGLGPAQAGMRIDVAVRALLRKIDAGDVKHLSEINALASPAGNKHLNSGMAADLVQIKRMKSLNAAKRVPGLVAFIKRPGFEDRMAVFGSDGLARRVESDRAVYEIEYSVGLEALGREAANLASTNKNGGKSRPPVPKSRGSDESTKTDASEREAGGRSGSATPEGDNDRGMPTPASSHNTLTPTLKQFPSQETVKQEPSRNVASRTRSAPAPVGVSPLKAPSAPRARSSVIKWDMTSDSESSESDEESDSEDEDTLAAAVGRSMKRSSLPPVAAPQQSTRPASIARPLSFAAQGLAPNDGARRVEQPEGSRRDGDRRDRRADDDLAEKYRAQVMQTRERRELARSGLIERQRTSDAMREHETAKRSSHTSPTSSNTNRAHRKSLSAVSTPAGPGGNPHRTSIGMLPVPQGQSSNNKRLSAASGRGPSVPVSPPNLNNRRSLSHVDVSNFARQSMYATPTAMMPMMPYQNGQPGMMFMQMPMMAYQQAGMGFVPMNGMQQQYHQNTGIGSARPQDRERRRSSVAPVPHQQTPPRRHGGRSGRASPIQ